MTRSTRGLFASFVIAAVLVVASPTTASAAENGDWSIDPSSSTGPGARSRFNYTLKPDQIFRDTFVVANVSDEPLTLDLYPTDAYNTRLDGGFALLAEDETPSDVGSWIELATDQVTLEPLTQAEVPFSISIPLSATPGDHAGGIVAQNVDTEAEINGDGVGVEVRRRVGTRVYVRVDGPLKPALQVTQIVFAHDSAMFPPLSGTGSASIGYEIKNTGNTRITPTADVRVRGLLGGTIVDFRDRELKELLPGSRLVITEKFTGVPALNRLSVKVTVTGGDAVAGSAESSASTTAWVVSWGSVFCLLLVPVLFLLWRRVRRREGAPVEESTPPARVKDLVGA